MKRASLYYNIVLLVLLVFFVISFITNILNSIIVAVKDSYDLSLSEVGLLPFSFFIAYAVMSIPAGFLAERYSDKRLLKVSFVVIFLGCLFFVIDQSYGAFVVTLFVLGSAMAILQVIINPMLRVAGGEEHFAFNSVVAQLVFGLASFLSPMLYVFFVNPKSDVWGISQWMEQWVSVDKSWVSLYIVFGLMSMVLLVVSHYVTYPVKASQPKESSTSWAMYQEVFKDRKALLYFTGIFCYVGFEQGVGNWLSPFLLEYHGFNPETIGAQTVSYFWAMLTAGCILGLLLLKLMDSKRVLIYASLATFLGLLIALFGPSHCAVYAFSALGFTISVMWSIIFALGLNSVPKHHGAMAGLLCTGIAGGAIIPLIIGLVGDVIGLKWALFGLMIPLAYILSIGFWSKPLIQNKTI